MEIQFMVRMVLETVEEPEVARRLRGEGVAARGKTTRA